MRFQVELEMTRSGRIRKKINTQKYYAAVEGEGSDDDIEGGEPEDMEDYKPESDTEEVVAEDDEGRDSLLIHLHANMSLRIPKPMALLFCSNLCNATFSLNCQMNLSHNPE